MNRHQTELFLKRGDLVSADHPYRQFEHRLDMDALTQPYEGRYSDQGRLLFGVKRVSPLQVLPLVKDRSVRR